MKYIQPGDIVFHCGKGILAHAIKRLTECPWSHVSMVVSVGDSDFMVLDVVGTRVVQSIRAHSDDVAWHVRAPSHLNREGGIAVRKALALHEELPRSYPYLELLAYLPFLRRTALGRCLLRKTDQMVCSALVATAWEAAGLQWRNGAAEWATPKTIWDQANQDCWPLVCTKRGYDAGL